MFVCPLLKISWYSYGFKATANAGTKHENHIIENICRDWQRLKYTHEQKILSKYELLERKSVQLARNFCACFLDIISTFLTADLSEWCFKA